MFLKKKSEYDKKEIIDIKKIYLFYLNEYFKEVLISFSIEDNKIFITNGKNKIDVTNDFINNNYEISEEYSNTTNFQEALPFINKFIDVFYTEGDIIKKVNTKINENSSSYSIPITLFLKDNSLFRAITINNKLYKLSEVFFNEHTFIEKDILGGEFYYLLFGNLDYEENVYMIQSSKAKEVLKFYISIKERLLKTREDLSKNEVY